MYKPKQEITVVIPVYNRKDSLQTCLEGLSIQTIRQKIRVIIVDDASSQAGIKELAESFSASYYRNRKRFGSAYCKNIGILNSDSEFILFLDSDINFLSDTTVQTMLNAIYTLPECAEVGGEALVDSNNEVKYVFGRNIDLSSGKSQCDYIPINSEIRGDAYWNYDYIPNSNCMIRRSIAINLNGFDDAYNCIGEDKDFGFRVSKLGFKNYVVRDSVVHHKFSTQGRNKKTLHKLYKTQIRFYLRYFGLRETIIMVYRYAIRILLQQDYPLNQHEHVLNDFENYYRKEVLGFNPKLISSRISGAYIRMVNVAVLVNAFGWNILHQKGLTKQGSSQVVLG
ncbi:MAG: glycosyltransferase [Anaerolineales bacterium]|nr:glycosyltransferase [Anaerolineales bacterium]